VFASTLNGTCAAYGFGRLPCSQTPLPWIFAVHLKQTVTAYLFVLPFTLVDIMGWRMVPFVTLVACESTLGEASTTGY
jgi:predicted membrane chloride channel (bestrophin family)